MSGRLGIAVAACLALASCAAGRTGTRTPAATLEERQPRLAFQSPVDLATAPDSFWINGPVSVQVKLARDGRVRMARVTSGYAEFKDPRPEWTPVVDSLVVAAARRSRFVMPKEKVDLEQWIPLEYTLPADAVGWPHDRLVGWVGRLVDDTSGAPLEGAVVVVADERLGAMSDAGGIARIPSLRAGRFELITRAPGYATRRDSVTVTPGSTDTTILRLTPWTGPIVVDTLWTPRRNR